MASFFPEEFLNMELTKKEIKKRKNEYSMEEFEGYPEVDYYYEYKRLGGKKNRKKYFENLDIFLEETHDIFVHGDYSTKPQYDSREDSFDGVSEIANITLREVYLIYDSVNNVTAYT
jgi:hypothetical protein